MATLKDIARVSGISVTQVSRALNDYDDVSEETKLKVRTVAEELGYVKNINASRLALQNSNQISVIVSGLGTIRNNEDNILMSILNGVYGFAESIDYEVLPLFISKKHRQSYVAYCKSRLITGVIFVGARYDDPYFTELIHSDFPCVGIDVPIIGNNKACVLINDGMYSQMAVNELIRRGYKRIGMINGHEYASVSIERLQGYKNTIMQNGLVFDEVLVRNGEFEYERAAVETEELLKLKVDAIFCASDVMAMAALEIIRKKGLSVPRDIALFGFDGLMFTRVTTPNISTIVQNNYQKGYEAAKLLHKILRKESYAGRVYVDCEMRITDSI